MPAPISTSLTQAIKHYLAERGPASALGGDRHGHRGDRRQGAHDPTTRGRSRSRRCGANLGLERLVVLNDFTALALSLPALDAAQLRRVGAGAAVAGAPLALLGPGTGLGVSGLLPARGACAGDQRRGRSRHPWPPPTRARRGDHRLLRRRFGHASAERALSGPGLENLHQALAQLKGDRDRSLSAVQITARRRATRHCAEVMELFFGLLGNVAGNLALTLGARGGVYVGGGIVLHVADRIERSVLS